MHQKDKSSASKVKFRQANNRCKRVLEAAKLTYVDKTKKPITSWKLGFCNDSGISLPVFPSRTNLKPHNISVTPKMVKKVIINLDLSKPSGPDSIPVVVLKNCEPELSYILPEIFNKCLKEFCFPDCWKVSSVVPVFKNVGERSTLETTALLVFFLWLAKSLKNL